MSTINEVIKNFFDKIEITGYCWIWNAYTTPTGYGYYSVNLDNLPKENFRAHRFAWLIFKGDIPEDLNVLHKCDNKLCVNPEHLYIGSQAANLKDHFIRERLAKEIGISKSAVGLIEYGVRVVSEEG